MLAKGDGKYTPFHELPYKDRDEIVNKYLEAEELKRKKQRDHYRKTRRRRIGTKP